MDVKLNNGTKLQFETINEEMFQVNKLEGNLYLHEKHLNSILEICSKHYLSIDVYSIITGGIFGAAGILLSIWDDKISNQKLKIALSIICILALVFFIGFPRLKKSKKLEKFIADVRRNISYAQEHDGKNLHDAYIEKFLYIDSQFKIIKNELHSNKTKCHSNKTKCRELRKKCRELRKMLRHYERKDYYDFI